MIKFKRIDRLSQLGTDIESDFADSYSAVRKIKRGVSLEWPDQFF